MLEAARSTALLLALLLLTGACTQDRAAANAPASATEARPVRLAPAASGTLARTVTATGTLAAEDQVVLNTKVAGRLAELPVDLGSIVRTGDLVAALDVTDFQLAVEQAETALTQARARLGVPLDGSGDELPLERSSLVKQAKAVLEQTRLQQGRLVSLHKDGILARSELDAAEADRRVADARYNEALEEVRSRIALVAERRTQLRIAQQRLADAQLRAPFEGAVRERHLSIGGYLDVGAAVVTIVRTHPLRLRVPIPEREATAVRVGQGVRVRVDGGPDAPAATGTVARVSPAVDESTRTVLIEAEIPNTDGALRPGAFATAEIVTDPSEQAILVPASAIITFAGVTKVLGVTDGKVVERRIRIGRRVGDDVEVLEGIAAGDPIIVEPGGLTDGQVVTEAS
jgi:RND family efflux transporter MFP subunit